MATEKSLLLAKELWNFEPHSKSQRDLMLDTHKVITVACGRRWGKSQAFSIDMILYALQHPKSRQIIVSATHENTKVIVNEIIDKLSSTEIFQNCWKFKKSPQTDIELSNGSVIWARTANARGALSLRGKWCHRLIVDEAAYIEDDVFESILTPLLADKDGDLVLLSTPAGRNSFFYRSYQRGLDQLQTRYKQYNLPSHTNPLLPKDYLENERLTKPDRIYRIEYLAEFADAEGMVFKHVDSCLTDTVPELTNDTDYIIGIDTAEVDDYTVITVLDKKLKTIVEIERFNKIDWTEQADRIVKLANKYINLAKNTKSSYHYFLGEQKSVSNNLNTQIVVEKNAQASFLSMLRERGLNVKPFITTMESKKEIIDDLVVAFEQKKISIPKHLKNADILIEELKSYQYTLSPSGNVKMSAPSGMHDDSVMSLAFTWSEINNIPATVSVKKGNLFSYV